MLHILACQTEEENRHRRNRRYSFNSYHQPFPRFGGNSPMSMSYPGTGFGSPMASQYEECITGEIVCPDYCVMEDEWGCRYCPCGPGTYVCWILYESMTYCFDTELLDLCDRQNSYIWQMVELLAFSLYSLAVLVLWKEVWTGLVRKNGNISFSASGMSPAVVHSGPRPELPEREESEDKCLGTILCMLSCKDGYKLGPKQQSGCQSCSCVKKNQADVTLTSMYTVFRCYTQSVRKRSQTRKDEWIKRHFATVYGWFQECFLEKV